MLYLVNRYGVAEMLGLSAETVSKMYKRGELPEEHGMENRKKPVWTESKSKISRRRWRSHEQELAPKTQASYLFPPSHVTKEGAAVCASPSGHIGLRRCDGDRA